MQTPFRLYLLLLSSMVLAQPPDSTVLWRNTFDPDGANVGIGSVEPEKLCELKNGVVKAGPIAGSEGRVATFETNGEGEGQLTISDAFNPLCAMINRLPPGEYDLTLSSDQRATGRVVRRITLHIKPGSKGASSWPFRTLGPKVGPEMAHESATFAFTILPKGTTAKDFAFPQGSLQEIRLTQWIGGKGSKTTVDMDNLTIRSRSIPEAMRKLSAKELVSLAQIECPNTVYLFHASEQATFIPVFTSAALGEIGARVELTVEGRDVSVIRDVVLKARGRTSTELPFSVVGWPYGIYKARLTATTAQDGSPIASRTFQFGVCSDTKIGKARPGEFLYGVDTSLWAAHSVKVDWSDKPTTLEFTRWMGVDIIRGGFLGWAEKFIGSQPAQRKAEVVRYAPLYKEYGLSTVAMIDPPDAKFKKDFEHIEKNQVEYAEWLAREHRGWITYYELGNEPDLPVFYDGPISKYAESYVKLYEAIKRGNPDAVVMNGGFAYREERIREFFKLIRPDQIDAIAYHGHGAGVEAERESYRAKKRLAIEGGFESKPLVETESGMAAITPDQEIEKGRTCIQKMVYAQSLGAPLFLWFRIQMGNRDYGCTLNEVEPRPVILSYRAMTETLRGYRFERIVPAQNPDCELYLFHQNGGNGRVLVGWSNATGAETSTYLRVGAATAPRTVDMFGNAVAVGVGKGGLLMATLTESPVFLCWNAEDGKHEISTDPGFFPNLNQIELAPDRENNLTLGVRNPWSVPLSATLALSTQSSTALTLSPNEQKISLAPGEAQRITLSCKAGPFQSRVTWPQSWTVFLRVAKGTPVAGAVPEELPGANDKPVKPRTMSPRENTLEIGEAMRFVRQIDTRVESQCYAEVISDRDQTVTMGAAADWWMEWFVNGEPVFDTLKDGNGGSYSILSYTFDLPLKKGRNVLACRVKAGSHGCKLLIGPPESIRRARGLPPADRLVLLLTDGGTSLVHHEVPLVFRTPVPREAGSTPIAVLTGRHVVNLFERVPGDSRWWRGNDDLSANVFLHRDDTHLHARVDVADQSYESGDGVILSIADVSGKKLLDVAADMATAAERREGITCVRLQVPLDRLPAAEYLLTVRINDTDDGVHKQYLQWHSDDVATWHRAILKP